ncbi:MAG: hypothetical protein WC473_02750 [Patescibacteria group bacterium]|jgi:hypothetical protein
MAYFLLLLLVLLMAFAMVMVLLGVICGVALFLTGVTILFTCGKSYIGSFLWYTKNSAISLAIALAGLMIIQTSGWIINKHQERLQRTPEYQAAVKSNAEALDRFLSCEPMKKEEMWWVEQYNTYPNRDSTMACLRTYRETLEKHFGPCPDTNQDWEKYFDERVWPVLYNDVKMVYCPQSPPVAEAVP